MSSSATPLVSGITRTVHTNCTSIIAPKKAKTQPPTALATIGNSQVIAAAATQWVVDASACHFPRTALGVHRI